MLTTRVSSLFRSGGQIHEPGLLGLRTVRLRQGLGVRLWGVAHSTHYARRVRASEPVPPRRRGRKPVLGDEALVGKIREVLVEAGALVFWGEGYRKVWARLRFEGILTSK